MKHATRAESIWVLAPSITQPNGPLVWWQCRTHRVSQGQTGWLQLGAQDWLQVQAGRVQLAPALGMGAALDSRWSHTAAELGEPKLECKSGAWMGAGDVRQAGAADLYRIEADSAQDAELRVWRPATWVQRVVLALRHRTHQPTTGLQWLKLSAVSGQAIPLVPAQAQVKPDLN